MEQVYLVLREEGWLDYLEFWRKFRLVLNELKKKAPKFRICCDGFEGPDSYEVYVESGVQRGWKRGRWAQWKYFSEKYYSDKYLSVTKMPEKLYFYSEDTQSFPKGLYYVEKEEHGGFKRRRLCKTTNPL